MLCYRAEIELSATNLCAQYWSESFEYLWIYFEAVPDYQIGRHWGDGFSVLLFCCFGM